MKLGDLSNAQLSSLLRAEGVSIAICDYNIRLKSKLKEVVESLSLLYPDYRILDDSVFIDFHISVDAPTAFRRWFRPKIQFELDGYAPFLPIPRAQAFAFFEWGLNWCIANHIHKFLILHAAVLERNGYALILPAPPGSGKSTLCATLMFNGWRLLSDELTLVSLDGGSITPIPRPVSLKNNSIDIIRQREKEALFGPEAQDTAKGRLSHVRPPKESIQMASENARPKWVVFPKYQAESKTSLMPLTKQISFMRLCENAFNYNLLGLAGFHAMRGLSDTCDSFEFAYSNLDEAIALFKSLSDGDIEGLQ